jgi:hypothetical protein
MTLVVVGFELQGVAILLGSLSAYSMWCQLKELSLADQATVSESLAAQSFEILPVQTLQFSPGGRSCGLPRRPMTDRAGSPGNGFNALEWSDATLTYWAVSDLDGVELQNFKNLS